MPAWGEAPRAMRDWKFDPRTPPSNNPGNGWVPDPVTIVRQNMFPRGTEGWGLDQRVAYLNAYMAPYTDRFYWARDRLAQAQGLLYQQYGPASGRPF